nr:MAG TPA: Head decoration protein, Viral protein.5A [Caudoviricetes sp.]
MSKNKIYTSTDQRIFQGNFPIETNALTLQTKVEAGDIVALSTDKKFGKYDGTTYSDVYGVAYETIENAGQTVVILTGGLVKNFVKFNGKEEELTIALRKIGIFIK